MWRIPQSTPCHAIFRTGSPLRTRRFCSASTSTIFDLQKGLTAVVRSLKHKGWHGEPNYLRHLVAPHLLRVLDGRRPMRSWAHAVPPDRASRPLLLIVAAFLLPRMKCAWLVAEVEKLKPSFEPARLWLEHRIRARAKHLRSRDNPVDSAKSPRQRLLPFKLRHS